MAGPELVILDQRLIPEKLSDIVARRGSDVAYYLRLGACRGGPVMAQVAAYGLALTAAERATQPAAARDAELRRTQEGLASARPSSRLPAWAMGRMAALRAALGEEVDGPRVAEALRIEADAIAAHVQAGQAAIAAALAVLLAEPRDRPLGLLLHGDLGALSGGLVGSGITALRRLRDEGRALRVFVTETRPFMDGARLASWELRQAGIEHKVIPDSAVAWLFEREPIDAVLIDAEWIAANGDSGAVIGSRAIAAQAAAVGHEADRTRPRVIVCGLCAVIDPATPDGAAIPVELRPARDQAAYLAELSIRVSDALVPASDVIPVEAISALVTERGVLVPPSAEAIGRLLESAASSSPQAIAGSPLEEAG
jgi:methylthioribose-1-phosphate isomerase